ncbi:hypothetical protein CDAR_557071 [Caerostris darwini]|uniref:Uncharacterized protein n=1 Tax=Caerostris darwini TaxID=1538125 RepID=A0AAV4TZW9_9ARAC|nr:hypothetical protein CDAR_557071 [Caerostris darwini]
MNQSLRKHQHSHIKKKENLFLSKNVHQSPTPEKFSKHGEKKKSHSIPTQKIISRRLHSRKWNNGKINHSNIISTGTSQLAGPTTSVILDSNSKSYRPTACFLRGEGEGKKKPLKK